MCISFIRSSLVLGLLVTTAGVGSAAHASTTDEIPSQLRNDPLDDDLNGPCSLCRVNSIKAAEKIAGSRATLVIYFDDERGELFGSLEITVLLYNGEYHTVIIEDVSLAYEQITVFELEPGLGWDWSLDVQHLWVEPIPAGPSG
jgi:hypothetical protein